MRTPPVCLGDVGLQTVSHPGKARIESAYLLGLGEELRKLRWGTQEFSGKNLSEFAARREDSREYSIEQPQPSMCVWRLPQEGTDDPRNKRKALTHLKPHTKGIRKVLQSVNCSQRNQPLQQRGLEGRLSWLPELGNQAGHPRAKDIACPVPGGFSYSWLAQFP